MVVGKRQPPEVAKDWVQNMNEWFTQAMNESIQEKTTFSKLAQYISPDVNSANAWELQKLIFIGSFTSVVAVCKPEMAKELRYALQRDVRKMNVEFLERYFGPCSVKFNGIKANFVKKSLSAQEEERKNDIILLLKLVLDAYQRLHERVQHLKFCVAEESKGLKNSNSMVANLPKNCASYKEYRVVNDFYTNMPKIVLAMAAHNIGDSTQELYYLEQAISSDEHFNGNKDCYDEAIIISKPHLVDMMIQAYNNIEYYDETNGLYKQKMTIHFLIRKKQSTWLTEIPMILISLK